jgi:hypothetical protein
VVVDEEDLDVVHRPVAPAGTVTRISLPDP